MDIAGLFQCIYPPNRVYLKPTKARDGEKLVDVMVIGDEAVLLIQASAHSDASISFQKLLERPRSDSIEQLGLGADKLGAAVAHIKQDPVLRFQDRGHAFEIDLRGHLIIAIVIVKELFNNLYREYSTKAFAFIDIYQTPMLFFDHPQLIEAVSQCLSEDLCASENTFLAITDQIFSVAVERGEFSRF